MIYCKYFIRITILLTISLSISYFLLSVSSHADNKELALKPKNDGEQSAIGFIITIYTVSLGFIGLFSMYNSLEIYKKKEQFDKELKDMVKEHKNEIHNLHNNLKTKIKDLSTKKITEMDNKHEEITKKITEQKDDILQRINSSDKNIMSVKKEMDRNDYLYIIRYFSLIKPLDEAELIESLFWISQNGCIEDIEMLNKIIENKEKYSDDTIVICQNAIKEITMKKPAGSSEVFTHKE